VNDDEIIRASQVIRDIMNDVRPLDVSSAERSNICADMLVERENAAALRRVLVSGFAREWAREFSHIRRASRKASDRLVMEIQDLEDHPGDLLTQLSFTIVSPGLPPTPLSGATHELLQGAYTNEVRQVNGRSKNVRLIGHCLTITRPYPGVPIGVLIDKGILTIADLTPPEERKEKAA
jgi:hypothetical protein